MPELSTVTMTLIGLGVFFVVGTAILIIRSFRKVIQGEAIIRNGLGGSKVSLSGMIVLPVIHKAELMDISVKRVEIERTGKDGLICKDNMRADIKVAFFVKVNQDNHADVLLVAKSLGTVKASSEAGLKDFFDAKFSEALKTVGKKFDFEQLYTDRLEFKKEIIQIIGKDLNGYVLEDCAIDYLEQTDVNALNADNILDAEGIKKIHDRTATQAIRANEIMREKEKTIKQQDVKAREAILLLEKQQREAEEKQKREIASITSREEAEAEKIAQEERLKSEKARITTDEEIAVQEENKNRQIIVAQKAKERTEAIETERVDKERLLEQTEKEKIVQLAQIEKEKAVEEQRKNIQDVIRARVMVEKEVVVEQERIKDTEAFAGADRAKKVAVTDAQRLAEESLIRETKAAESAKISAVLLSEQHVIEADANLKAAEKQAEAVKIMAAAKSEEEAVVGLSEARVIESKAIAYEKEGIAKARVLEATANAEAKGIEIKAAALEKEGSAKAGVLQATAESEAKGREANAIAKQKEGEAEAAVMSKKFTAEAVGIEEKANAMKLLDGVGREHEEFKLRLDKEKEIDLAQIAVQRDIAAAQASVINEALRSAKIDIVGGETMFFDKIVGAITQGKAIDRMVDNSEVLTDVKRTFITGDQAYFKAQINKFINQFGIGSEDLKNLTLSGLLLKMSRGAETGDKESLDSLLDSVKKAGFGDLPAKILNS